ncbi:hypothetical protein [Streptomyces bullii]|uniref:Uncharacterized protein n=1 Tax=Streptomyces bullii TaxID=349910 RepID=A0ABW0V017_9ACTN
MDPKRRHRSGPAAHAPDAEGGSPTPPFVAERTGAARAEDTGTANSGCQAPSPDATAPVPAPAVRASDTGDSLATAPNAFSNTGVIATIVQAPRDAAPRIRKRTLLIGTALAALTVLASTTVADGPAGRPRAATATPTDGSTVSAGPSAPGASPSPSGSATPKPTDRAVPAPDPSAGEVPSPVSRPAPTRKPDAAPPVARPPKTDQVLSAGCTKETGPSHPAWPVQYADTNWGPSEAAEEHDLSEDGELVGGFRLMRANRPNLTYYWATGWTAVDPDDTETWLVLTWTDGTTASSCRRRLSSTGHWHDTIAVPRYINGKFIRYQACQGSYGRPATCTKWT